MRLRLAHKMVLLLTAAVSIAVIAFGTLLAWNLRTGFGAYLEGRDIEHLEQVAVVASERLVRPDQAEALASGRIDGDALLEESSRRHGDWGLRHRPPPPSASQEDAAAHDLERPPRTFFGPPPHPPPDGFEDRVAIYRQDGVLVFGKDFRRESVGAVERPVVIAGKTVAILSLRSAPPVPHDLEIAFLRRQYIGIAAIGAALMLLAAAAGAWSAARLVRPLLSIQDVTKRIAGGELTVRLDANRSDEVGDLISNVNRMAESLERLDGARRRWMAEISHELRTPLTVLRGELEALEDGIQPLNAQAVVSLREEVLRLNSLVDDLHLLAMADLGSLRISLQECDAVDIVRRVHARFASSAAARGLPLDANGLAASAWPVIWDPQRVDQLLGILMDNSLRYTDAPGRIRTSMSRQEDRIIIEVEDSAPSVNSKHLDRLFEPLYRENASRGRADGGSGLGLAICAALVHALGGRIEAYPSPLGGLGVRVHLPSAARTAS